MPLNVGIAFVTGRKQFQRVLRTYVNNWLEYGLIESKEIRLHLFVVYDTAYFNTEARDYRNIPAELTEMVESVNFYGGTALREERQRLINAGVIDDQEGELLFGEGYAKKRNAALYFALKHGMDRLLFIDDDEYPLAVFRESPDYLTWTGQSILGTHLKYSAQADITHGYHCGYISPIPKFDFNQVLTEQDFRSFIEATSNDIISWESVKNTIIGNNGVTYADRRNIDRQAVSEVGEVGGMKFISGANLCFNLSRIRDVPAFYNPPGARGEDAFMSTTLTNLKVVKVPCYTFHDAFLKYQRILNGVLPYRLLAVNASSLEVRQRFVRASIGWIRYKPLLINLTQPNRYASIVDKMKRDLDLVIPKMVDYFETEKFLQVRSDLDRFDRNVRRHHRAFIATREAWAKVVSHARTPRQTVSSTAQVSRR